MKQILIWMWLAGFGGSTVAQSLGTEPNEREISSLVAGYWKNFTEQQHSTFERCRTGQGGIDCLGVVYGPMQVDLLGLKKIRCVVRGDQRAYLCTYLPSVSVTHNNSMLANAMQAQLSTETSWSFARTGGALHLVAGE